MDLNSYVKIQRIESGSLQIPAPEKFSFPCPTCQNSINIEKKLKFLLRDDLEAVENTLSHAKEKREFCEAVKAKRFDLITYFRRLREITAKYSAMVLIAYIKDNHDFLNERCNKCGLGVTIHYKFSFTPPSIPSPTVPELAALELDDELTRHHVRRELGFKSWEQVKTWLSGEDTRPLIEKLKEVSAILETIDYFRHPRSDLNTLELSLGSLQAFANSIMDIIRELEQEVQNRPKIYLNLVEEYSHTVAPKGPMQTSG